MKYRTKEDIEAAKAIISPPGDTLLETMERLGIKQPELAERMGRPLKTINEIIKGKAAITPETALQLERVLGVPAEFWTNREQNYRLEKAAIEDSENLLKAEDWAKKFPLKEMIKHGWIENTNERLAMINNLLAYFSVADTKAFHSFYEVSLHKYLVTSIRSAAIHRTSLATWMRAADLIAHRSSTNEFSKSNFQDALLEIQRLTLQTEKERIIEPLVRIANEAGVVVVFSPEIEGNDLLGSARWVYNKPVIQMRNHYRGLGQFWNVFYHEAAHIMVHGKRDIFIDDASFVHARKEKEAEANQFAFRYLCNKEVEEEMEKEKEINTNSILGVAKRTKTNPAVLAQCLFANKKISENMVNRFEEDIVLG